MSLRNQLIQRSVTEQIQVVGNRLILRRHLDARDGQEVPTTIEACDLCFIELQPLAKLRGGAQNLFVYADDDHESYE